MAIAEKGPFVGKGFFKKTAKKDACCVALKQAFDLHMNPEGGAPPVPGEEAEAKMRNAYARLIAEQNHVTALHDYWQEQAREMGRPVYETKMLGGVVAWTCNLTFGVRVFVGQGFSKTKAKEEAARIALESLNISPPSPRLEHYVAWLHDQSGKL